jgi:cytochrome c-type biogenesis protein
MLQPLLTSVWLGLLSSASPCLLPLYPGFLAYLAGTGESEQNGRVRYWLGICILAGVLTMMVALGLVIAALSISVGKALAVAIPVSDGLIVLLGILLLLNLNPFKRLPQIQAPLLKHPLANAFVYGLLYGPLALPCSGPLVVGFFALSFNAAEALSKLLILLAFGLGFGLPLLVLSFLAGTTQRRVTQFLTQRSRLINVISGLLLLAIGIIDLISNWELIRAAMG